MAIPFRLLRSGGRLLKQIPLVGSIPEHAKKFKRAVELRNPYQSLYHGAATGAAVGFPMWIGSEVVGARRRGKMLNEELGKLQKIGFLKEASVVGLAGKAALAPIKFLGIKGALGGAAATGAIGTGIAAKKALERSRRVYGATPKMRGMQYV